MICLHPSMVYSVIEGLNRLGKMTRPPEQSTTAMPDDLQGFNQLLREARAGSDVAARQLVDRFGPSILNRVRQRLDPRLRNVFDSADFTQAVWASFFALPPEKGDFRDEEALLRYLDQLARNKVIDQIRRRLRHRNREIRREVPLPSSRHLAATSATASQEAIANERWQQALDKEPRHLQEVLHSFRAGLSPEQIAQRVGVSARTVRRALRRLQLGLEP
jgi:RNA polymerase sigma factor (sigma-70 family)